MEQPNVTKSSIEMSLRELDSRCQEEYEVGLIGLLSGSDQVGDARRLRRLGGVALKANFAVPVEATVPSLTGAKQAWKWDAPAEIEQRFATSGDPAYQLLLALRDALPRYNPWYYDDGHPPTIEELQLEADTERGLFKFMALWLKDRLGGEQTRTWKEYQAASEGNTFKTLLDLADALTKAAVLAPLYAALMVPEVAVTVAVIGLRYGYRAVFDDGDTRREPDNRN
jgi:hypothetical protein